MAADTLPGEGGFTETPALEPDAKPGCLEVLVVEDEPLVRQTLTEILDLAGFCVLEAADADQAMAMLESFPEVRLLLLDIMLPGRMDGLALAREVRQIWPNLPILFTSGQSESEARVKLAGQPFLPKPYRVAEVVSVVQHLVAVAA